MLVALLDELDTECQEHQKAWLYDRDCMTDRIVFHQRQMRAAQAVLHRMQNRTLDRSKVVWKQIIIKQWCRMCKDVEVAESACACSSYSSSHVQNPASTVLAGQIGLRQCI